MTEYFLRRDRVTDTHPQPTRQQILDDYTAAVAVLQAERDQELIELKDSLFAGLVRTAVNYRKFIPSHGGNANPHHVSDADYRLDCAECVALTQFLEAASAADDYLTGDAS